MRSAPHSESISCDGPCCAGRSPSMTVAANSASRWGRRRWSSSRPSSSRGDGARRRAVSSSSRQWTASSIGSLARAVADEPERRWSRPLSGGTTRRCVSRLTSCADGTAIYCMPLSDARTAERPSSLRDYAYRELRDAIVNGELAPGERLRDPELEQWLGVSRTPIREAIARLETAGLVQTRRAKL